MEQVLQQLAMPCLTVLNPDYVIVDSDERLETYFERAGVIQEDSRRLPRALEQVLRERLAQTDEAYFAWSATLFVRASKLNGLAGECIVISLEPVRTRAPLDGAVQRYSLSRRETEVLECILCGFNAGQIAERLHVSKRTVGEYFKQLAAKIGARNRSEMIARVFDWQAD